MNWEFLAEAPVGPLEEEVEEFEVYNKLQWLLGLLRAQYWSYQNSHWVARGDAFYGDHLMFQRLYTSLGDQVDTLAEKLVGTYGPEAVNPEDMLGMFMFWNERWDSVECLHRRGLTSEKDCQTVIEETYEELKESGELSLGMDDFLMSLASEHETNQYLLRQVIRTQEDLSSWVPLEED